MLCRAFASLALALHSRIERPGVSSIWIGAGRMYPSAPSSRFIMRSGMIPFRTISESTRAREQSRFIVICSRLVSREKRSTGTC
jgi:hypothetical protein